MKYRIISNKCIKNLKITRQLCVIKYKKHSYNLRNKKKYKKKLSLPISNPKKKQRKKNVSPMSDYWRNIMFLL